jgi:hypothetical protein
VAFGTKDEFPPLLPLGFHPMTVAELRTLCVTRFNMSITRTGIMDGLERVFGLLSHTGFRLEVWVNGSFMTEKFNPEDSDVAVRVQGEDFDAALPPQRAELLLLANADLKPAHKCDLYVFPEYRAGHTLYDYGQWRRAYWLSKFGFSRAEEPKGLAVVQLPYLMLP